jgi:ATP-binding cassette subfamily C exporter for protease/lipase
MKTPAFFERSELTAALWAFRREFAMVAVFSAVANLLLLTPTIYMLQLYDRVMVSGSLMTLTAISLLCLFLLGIMSISEWTRSRILVHAGTRLDGILGTRVFNSSFDAYLTGSGASPARAFADLLNVRQFITGQGIFAFMDAPWTPIYLAVMFMLHPQLGWTGVVFVLLQAALTWFGRHKSVKPAETASKAGTDANIYLQGKLRNSEVLESMGMVQNLKHRWLERHRLYLHHSNSSQELASRVAAWSKLLRYTQQSISLAVGAILVIKGEMSIGGMIAANVLMTRALAPIDQLSGTWRQFVTARAAFERLEDLLHQFPERDPALKRVPPTGAVTLTAMSATAPGRESPILKNVNVDVPAGTVVAVIGPSGSGKSTLARVLMGIWPNVSGEVLLDGLPLQGWNRIEIGPHVGYLPQDVELFEGTIAENIARFSEVDSEKVIAAARCAGLHEMILRFPMGYDTPIGEAGNMLSGGQRQRIALARAVYGDPALVVLDEPNANLDDAGDAALMNTIRQLKSLGRTVFLITHRPGLLAAADWLVLLKDGEVVGNGPRDAVLATLQQQRATAPTALAAQPA